jgi:hypothetical protein
MKRTVLAAVLVVALVLGVVAYAYAETAVVNAVVNSKISLSITEDALSADWSALSPGEVADPKIFNFEVKSNKPWKFNYDGVDYIPNNGLLAAVLAPSKTAAFFDADDLGLVKGVANTSVNYTIDMVADGAYELDPLTTYTATYTYTAMQE